MNITPRLMAKSAPRARRLRPRPRGTPTQKNTKGDKAPAVRTAAGSSARPTTDATAPRLVLAASDGELYGHHKKFADLTLAYATTVEADKDGKDGIKVTNLAAYLREHPAVWEAQLAKGPHGEGTAWSCGHGLGRWRRHCGCAMSPAEYPSQEWRGRRPPPGGAGRN